MIILILTPIFAEELTRERNEQGECIPKNSLGKCENCLHSDQCGEGRFCCSYMKKCVKSGSESCYPPIANCKPCCHDEDDQETCTCKYEGFPKTWAKPTCQWGILDWIQTLKLFRKIGFQLIYFDCISWMCTVIVTNMTYETWLCIMIS